MAAARSDKQEIFEPKKGLAISLPFLFPLAPFSLLSWYQDLNKSFGLSSSLTLIFPMQQFEKKSQR